MKLSEDVGDDKREIENQTKQMVQVLLGSANVSGDVMFVLEELSNQGLLSNNELQTFQNIMVTKRNSNLLILFLYLSILLTATSSKSLRLSKSSSDNSFPSQCSF